LNYGITLIYNEKNKDIHAALKYLSRANILNPYLADIWGYLVYASLAVGLDIQAFQAQKEALKLKLSKLDLLKDISQMWMDRKRYEEARDCLDMALRARQAREGQRYQKKLDEFLKAIDPSQSVLSENDLRTKFRDIMVKSNAVKDDDWFLNNYIKVLPLTYK
jgi:tetratricopeptide (TPR) repeat protein